MTLRKCALILLLITLTACATPTPEIVEQTKIVEQTVEVTKIVQITTTPEPTFTPTPPAPLIAESDFEDDSGWWGFDEYDESYADIEDGKLIINIDAPNYYHLVGHEEMDPISIPYDMTFVADFLEGAVDSNLVIEFRWFDWANYAQISISGNRFIAFGVFLDNEYYSIIPWIKMRALSSGENQIRFIDTGNRIMLYANDTLLFDMPFDDLGYGSVILGLETWDSGGAIWSIDDFVVREVE